MKPPTLIPIDLKKRYTDGYTSGHPDITDRKQYLAKIAGRYYAGSFSRTWHGWVFDGAEGFAGQLDGKDGTNWQAIWEITHRKPKEYTNNVATSKPRRNRQNTPRTKRTLRPRKHGSQ